MRNWFIGFAIVVICFSSFSLLGAAAVPSSPAAAQGDDEIKVIEAAAGDNFHRNVIRSAVKLQKEGKIKRSELLRLRVAMISPAFRENAKELAKIQMLSSENAEAIPMVGEGIDWDALLAFIEKLIPLILKLIDAITSVASISYSFPIYV